MGILDSIFKRATKEVKPTQDNSIFLFTAKEAFKGEVDKQAKRFPADVGEEHLIDITQAQRRYADDPLVSGIIDKHVDFIVGGGFFVVSEDKRAEEIAKDFIRDTNFDVSLREFVRAGLIAGTAYWEIGKDKKGMPTELKLLDSKYMYIRRDRLGNIEGYTQYRGFLKKKIDFTIDEIIHYAHRIHGDSVYGLGVITPLGYILKQKDKMIADMALIMSRKANAPYHIKLGDPEHQPSSAQIDEVRSQLEWLTSKHEWVTGGLTEIKAIDFGALGDKFQAPLEILHKELIAGGQVPEVLLGFGNIAEGLAEVQMDSFLKRVKSIQQEIEKVLENEIFEPLLEAHGLGGLHIEFEWGQPDKTEQLEEIAKITELLKLFNLDMNLRMRMEQRLAELMGFEDFKPQERREEEGQPQPLVPGQNSGQNIRSPLKQKSQQNTPPKTPKGGSQETYESAEFAPYDQPESAYEGIDINEDISLAEWINNTGFTYDDYVEEIQRAIGKWDFNHVPINVVRMEGGRVITSRTIKAILTDLSPTQKARLKDVFSDAFENGRSIRDIQKDIVDVVKIQPRGGTVGLDAEQIDYMRNLRANMIARTETIRLANEGAIMRYDNLGVTNVRWLAALSDRTCPICEGLNNKILSIAEAQGMIPAHVACRCTFVPVIE